MTILLLLAVAAWGQSTSTLQVPLEDQLKLQNVRKDVREILVGRPTVTGLPTFQNGIKFGDGTVITSTAIPSGTPVQVVIASSTASGTGTTDMVWDNTIPQINEGDQILASTMTPRFASSKLVVTASGWVAEDTNVSASGFICALYRDSTANAITAKANAVATNAEIATEHWAFNLETTVAANAVASTVFSLRCGLFGTGAGATLRWNGLSGGSILGGAMVTQIKVEEIKQ